MAGRTSVDDLERPVRLVSIPAAVSLGLAVVLIACGLLWLFGGSLAVSVPAAGVLVNPPGNTELTAPKAGTVVAGPVVSGSQVVTGQVVARIRTDNDTVLALRAPFPATVTAVSIGNQGTVAQGQAIATLAPVTQPMMGNLFVPYESASQLSVGDRVIISTSQGGSQLVGTVSSYSPLPASVERVTFVVGNSQAAADITKQGLVSEVIVGFTPDPSNPTGLQWSGGDAPTNPIISGSLVSADLIVDQETPWKALWGSGT